MHLTQHYKNYGKGYQEARVDLIGDLCIASGLVLGNQSYVGRLPKFCRPADRLMFQANNGGTPARIDVRDDGRVFKITGPEHGYLSLSNIAFPKNGSNTKKLELMGNYKPTKEWHDPTGLLMFCCFFFFFFFFLLFF